MQRKVYTGAKKGSYVTGSLKTVCDFFGIEYQYTRRLLKKATSVVRFGVTITEVVHLKIKRKKR